MDEDEDQDAFREEISQTSDFNFVDVFEIERSIAVAAPVSVEPSSLIRRPRNPIATPVDPRLVGLTREASDATSSDS